MKKFFIAMVVIVLFSSIVFGQYTFSVKPGAVINAAEFGFKTGKFNPFIGLDAAWLSVEISERDVSDYEYENYGWASYTHHVSISEYDFEGSALLLVPQIGLKYFLRDDYSDGEVCPYVKASVFVSIPFVSAEWRHYDKDVFYDEYGMIIQQYESEDKDKLEGNEKDYIEDILSVIGFNLAFGSEYYFSDKFSVGGEFGIKLFINPASISDSKTEYSESEYSYYRDTDSWENEFSTTFKLTQASVSLNYNF
ncbi:MAG: hypothetical protein H8E46_01165 [FCB group bacterium]|nr:hypothetical protein [FCB group bacterium]